MWVEVKSLDPAPAGELLGFAHQELKSRLRKLPQPFAVDASVAAGFDQSVAKRATNLLSHELRSGLKQGTKTFIGIPAGGLDKGIVTIEWTDNSGQNVRMISPKAMNNTYGCPLSAQPCSWTHNVVVTESAVSRQEMAYKILSVVDCCLLTLRVLPTAQPLGLASVSGARAESVTTVIKIRRSIDDAANQIKNGQSFRSVPGVVVIYNDYLIADRQDTMVACLGDITYPVSAATKNAGGPYYGMNGVLNSKRNTSVSAVVYRSRLFPDISLANPYASIPIDLNWLTGAIYSVDASGIVTRVA
jgi:hypothetical protein